MDETLLQKILREQLSLPSTLSFESLVRKNVDSLLVGSYRSKSKGSGLVLSDLREYQSGDEVKNIHWAASARTNHIQVKSYEEEKHLTIVPLLDTSASMAAGYPEPAFVRAFRFLTTLGLISLKQNDAFGLCTFSKDCSLIGKAKHGKKNLLSLLHKLSDAQLSEKHSDLERALQQYQAFVTRRSLCFIISDFHCPFPETELPSLARKHDVLCIFLAQTPDNSFPRKGLHRYRCQETGKTFLIDTGDRRVRSAIEKKELDRYQSFERKCSNSNIQCIYVDKDITHALEAHIRSHKKKRIHVS